MDSQHIINQIRIRIDEDKRDLLAVRKRLSRLPKEKIIVRHRGCKKEYYLITREPDTGKRIETYVSFKDTKSIIECINKEYCDELEPVLTEEIQLLEDFLKHFDPIRKYRVNVLVPPQLLPRFQPVVVPQKQKCREWAAEDYKRNSFPLDPSNMYSSEKGDVVRSRAECLAANILYNLDIDYRCECILYLDDRRFIFPDFTIMHPETGELWFIEIFGMMGNAEYALDAFHRINEYQKSQYGNHVLFFFDYPGAPFDPDAFKAVVRKTFLA